MAHAAQRLLSLRINGVKGPNKATRHDDKRLRPGGRKVLVPARMPPEVVAQARQRAAIRSESLGEYLERLVLADVAQATPPVTGA